MASRRGRAPIAARFADEREIARRARVRALCSHCIESVGRAGSPRRARPRTASSWYWSRRSVATWTSLRALALRHEAIEELLAQTRARRQSARQGVGDPRCSGSSRSISPTRPPSRRVASRFRPPHRRVSTAGSGRGEADSSIRSLLLANDHRARSERSPWQQVQHLLDPDRAADARRRERPFQNSESPDSAARCGCAGRT